MGKRKFWGLIIVVVVMYLIWKSIKGSNTIAITSTTPLPLQYAPQNVLSPAPVSQTPISVNINSNNSSRAFSIIKAKILHSYNIAGTVNYNLDTNSDAFDKAFKINAEDDKGLNLCFAKIYESNGVTITSWSQLPNSIITENGSKLKDDVDIVYNSINKMLLFNPDVFTTTQAEQVCFEIIGSLSSNTNDPLNKQIVFNF